MVRHKHGSSVVLGIMVLFSGFCLESCRRSRPRPTSVPRDSVYIEGGEFYWWAHCSYDSDQDADHCQTFNSGGNILKDEIFLPYDGGKAVQESELVIDGKSRFSGPYTVSLKNGRILIPKSDFDNQKRGIDSRLKSR